MAGGAIRALICVCLAVAVAGADQDPTQRALKDDVRRRREEGQKPPRCPP